MRSVWADLSEAQHLVEPELLEKLVASLNEQISGPIPSDPRQALANCGWRETVPSLKLLPGCSAAQYGAEASRASPNHGVRFHVSFHLWEDKPTRVAITPGKVCKRTAAKSGESNCSREPRYGGRPLLCRRLQDVLHRLQKQGCASLCCVCAMKRWCNWKRKTRSANRNKRKESSATSAGAAGQPPALPCPARLRVITLRKPGGTIMRLVTNIGPEQNELP